MRNLRAERATDVAALADNARSIARAADGREVIAVVKADAYGNGLVRCARALKGEAAMFAVAAASEAKRIVDAKIHVPVLIMGALSKDELRAAALLDGASLAVSSLAEAAYLDRLAAETGRRISVHIAVDSGMHRFGFAPEALRPIPRPWDWSRPFAALTSRGYTRTMRAPTTKCSRGGNATSFATLRNG